MAADEDQIPPLPPLPVEEDEEQAVPQVPEDLRQELGLDVDPQREGPRPKIKFDLDGSPPGPDAAPENHPPLTSALTPTSTFLDRDATTTREFSKEESSLDVANIPQLMAAIKNLEEGQQGPDDFSRGGQLKAAAAALKEDPPHPFLQRFGQKYLAHVVFGGLLLGLMLLYYKAAFKLSFLDLFYLPLLGAAYFIGAKFAVTSALMTVWYVVCLAWFRPELFLGTKEGTAEIVSTYPKAALVVHIALWAFLLLGAVVAVSYLRRRLQKEIKKGLAINEHLIWQKKQMAKVNEELQDYASDLETRIQERTTTLERSLATQSSLHKKIEGILLNTMDEEVVHLLMQGELKPEQRTISALAVELDNFAADLPGRRPELVAQDLSKFMSYLEPLLSAYHGYQDYLRGDHGVFEFGIPTAVSNHHLLAVLCALELRRVLKENKFPWSAKIGVTTGEAFVGMFGGKKQNYTALGEVVQKAVEFQQAALPGMILVDQAIFDRWGHLLNGRPQTASWQTTAKMQSELASLDEQIKASHDPREAAALAMQAGHLALANQEFEQAGRYFKQAVDQAPDVTEYKLAFAQATVEASAKAKDLAPSMRYELLSLKDPLALPEKINPAIINEFPEYQAHRFFDPAILYPAEVMDGSLGHGILVSFLSYALAVKMGLPPLAQIEILNAAFLADLGKQKIAEATLNRQRSLTEEELEEVRQHPIYSAQIAHTLGPAITPAILKLIECSHERPDGSGYPFGLVGNMIPPGARIIQVADTYAAMVSVRPYRSAWPQEEVLRAMEEGAQKRKFDARAVQTLHDILRPRRA